jgi:SAM-dependent methyltransferase
MVTMSAWRWGVFRGSQFLASGLMLVTRALAYATAGVLTKKELGRASAGRWSDFGMNEPYVLSGLFMWEETFYFRFLKPDDHILIVGSGSGRDLIGLRRAGYHADGLEPSEKAVRLARAMLTKTGVEAEVRLGWIETAPIAGPYDVFIFSWYCYSYIADRATRISALRAAAAHLAPGGRILLSYTVCEPVTRRLPRAIAAGLVRLTGSDWTPEATDVVYFERGGLHFEHQFVPGEAEEEARAAGLKVLHHQCGDDGFLALTADG